MKIRTMRYFILDGFQSIGRNIWMTIASVSTVVACMLIFGAFIVFTVNLGHVGKQIESKCEVLVWINKDASDAQVKEIGDKIKQISSVKNSILETKEQALENAKKQLGDKGHLLEGLEKNNPFRCSYKITLVDIRNAEQVEQQLQAIPRVETVETPKDTISKLTDVSELVRSISFWIMILLAFIAVFIISNTIKLAVFARRKEINIMKFVGATDWFIRWPFIIEGMVIGFVGSIVAFSLVALLYNPVVNTFFQSSGLVFTPKSLSEIISGLAIIFIFMGVVIGALGSGISIRKYLHV